MNLTATKNHIFLLKRFTLIVSLLIFSHVLHAQIVINYPAAPQGLTRGMGAGNLTVKIGFGAICTNTTVTIVLPESVTYVAGSVNKTGGSLLSGAITENNISNLNAPEFIVNGITAAGDITFTISRQAICGAAASGKDTVKVASGCGVISAPVKAVSASNSYNLLAPALSMSPPVAVTGAFLNNTYTRTTTVTNGGNGCLDTLRYYVVYANGGIVNTTNNAIIANGTSFSPYRTNGDTLFYKISGATLFGGNNLLCNGETVVISEPIKIIKCNANTSYWAGWGRTDKSICQSATGTSIITMANGVPNISVVSSDVTPEGACTPGVSKVVYTNNGTGGNAGAAYNITTTVGMTNNNTSPSYKGLDNGQKLGNFSINGEPGVGITMNIATAGTTSAPFGLNVNQFTSDPDGVGTGLDDLDGDGQYDDLAPGKSFTIYLNRIYIPDTVSCPRKTYGQDQLASTLSYTSMCSSTVTSTQMLNGRGGSTYSFCCQTSSQTIPGQIYGNTPFNVNVSISQTYIPLGLRPTDSIEVVLTLPSGVTYAGNATYRGDTTTTISVVGNKLHIKAKGPGASIAALDKLAMDFGLDLIYDCSRGAQVLPIPYTITYIADRACGAIDKLFCGTLSTKAICETPCPDGMSNKRVTVERLSLGWTDDKMTTKVSPSSLPALSLQTVTVYDTVKITSSAIEGAVVHRDLFYSIQFDKAGSADVMKFINGTGTFHFKAVASNIVIDVPISMVPTRSDNSTLSIWTWDLTPLLGTNGIPSTINPGDSVWVNMSYQVTNANNNLLYGATALPAPNGLSYFYNITAGNIVHCLRLVPPIYFLGIIRNPQGLGSYSNNGVLSGCNNAGLYTSYEFRHNSALQPFPNEYRPKMSIDSIIITLPLGVSYDNSVTSMYSYSYYPNKYGILRGFAGGITPIIRGNQLIFINPGTWKPSNFTNVADDMRLIFYVKSDCQAGSVSKSLSVGYQYFGKDFLYDSPNPIVPTISTQLTNTTALSVVGTARPAIAVQNNTGVVQGVLSQQYWDVQINNPSTVIAPYVWMALEKAAGTGGVSIDSVVLKPDNIKLTASDYNVTDKWYKISATGLASGAVQQARVYFKYSSCLPDSILFKAGWNCTGYPDPDPLTGYSCAAPQKYLKVIPNPSQVQMSILRQPAAGGSMNLCTADSVLVVVNSAQAGNLISPYVNVFPPTGIILDTPIQVEYPLGSGDYQNASLTPVSGGGYKIDLTAHTSIGSKGIAGTVINPGTAGRQAKIKIRFQAVCGISSGSVLSFNTYGKQPCGSPAIGDGSRVSTAGIDVTGASTTGGAGMVLDFSSPNIVCGQTSILNISNTPIEVATQPGDTAIYTLPACLSYVADSFVGGNNCSSCTATISSGAGGTTLVKVALQSGVAAGTSLDASFKVRANTGSCNNNVSAILVRQATSAFTCNGVACPNSGVEIARASKAFTTEQYVTSVTTAVIQPTCAKATGVIEVTSPAGTELEYSIDGINYQNSTSFVNLSPGTYTVYVRSGTACSPNTSTVVINSQPATPDSVKATVIQPTCNVATGSITVTSPTGTGLTYSLDGRTYQSSPTFSGLASGTYNITVSNGTCTSSSISVTINSQPATPDSVKATVTQPSCNVATGSITVTSPTGIDLTYSLDGRTYQSSPTFSGLASGTYNITVSNGTCTSSSVSVTINSQPTTPDSVKATVTQPSCTVATGSITVTSPTGSGLTYGLNGGNYQSSPTFSGLASGTYNITVSNGTCTNSSVSVTINSQPATPDSVKATVTQPTCNVATGSITVTSPTGIDLTYSLDSRTYQSSPTFSSLLPGTYNITVSNGTCTSSSVSVTINSQPVTPDSVKATVTQPTCNVATGSITVTSPTGIDLTYSLDGRTYQSSPTFSSLSSGTYNITVSNGTCTSSSVSVTINSQPVTPDSVKATVTQPSCNIATGSITITSPTATGLTYSLDGGNYQSSPTFSSLSSGTYNITVSNGTCMSSSVSVTINSQPVTPDSVKATVIQPSCNVATGSITVTSPTGSGLTYSLDGGNYQSSPTFSSLLPGTYNITVSNGTCTSSSVSVTINGQPVTPDSVKATVIQPSCNVATGSITVTSPTGSGLTYSLDGRTYQSSPTFSGLASGTYNITVSNGTCTSSSVSVTINSQPATPDSVKATVTQPSCNVGTGSIIVTSPTGIDLTYSLDSRTYQSSSTFSGLSSGTYNITVSNGTCSSSSVSVTINGQPVTPDSVKATVIQPSCNVATGSITVTSPTGIDLTYSLDGRTYQSSPTFSSLSSGTYNITVSNGTCTSSSVSVTINSQPVTPDSVKATVTQPSCNIATGSITITSPTATGLTYSLDGGNYQSSPTFSSLSSGTYNITVSNGTCISSSVSVTINGQPTTPDSVKATVSQPSCNIATGSITVTSPTGSGLTYGLNGSTYQSSPTFSGLVPGTYNITVSNGTCVSAPVSVTINSQPVTPDSVKATVIQPTCNVSTGSITVTSPIGSGLTYGLNGGNYQSSPTFSGLAPGTYNITVSNGICTSSSVSMIINSQPVTPDSVKATVIQPSCNVAAGSITVTSPTGSGLTYGLNGGNYQSSPTFSGLASGTYNITVSNGTCTSSSVSVTINGQPVTPDSVKATVTQPTCNVATGSITVTSPTGSGLTYSLDGGNYQSSPTFSGLASGTYNITVSNGTCSSSSVSVTINVQPPTLSLSVKEKLCNTDGTYTVFYQTVAGATINVNAGVVNAAASRITGIPGGKNLTITASMPGCDDMMVNVPAMTCVQTCEEAKCIPFFITRRIAKQK